MKEDNELRVIDMEETIRDLYAYASMVNGLSYSVEANESRAHLSDTLYTMGNLIDEAAKKLEKIFINEVHVKGGE